MGVRSLGRQREGSENGGRDWAVLPGGIRGLRLPCSALVQPVRGGTLLELVDLATGNTSVHKSPEPLLGFFFTETPGADAVLVGRACLELCEYAARRRGLR